MSGSQTTCCGKSTGISSALQKDSGGGTTTSSVLTKVAFSESAQALSSEALREDFVDMGGLESEK